MVEGPKYKRHAELLAFAFQGRKLRAVRRAPKDLTIALSALLGCIVLRIFAVGKQIFFVFGIRWQPQTEGNALRLHFGHGGGYVVEPSMGEAWGSKAAGGGHRREQHAQLQLEFEDGDVAEIIGACTSTAVRDCAPIRLLLWDELGSIYTVAPPEFIHAVEARATFDVNASEDEFATEDAVRLFSASEELVVDLVMDQARLPGVGNIIKCEGLFEAGIHPLRRSSKLNRAEWLLLLAALRGFSDRWYKHCQRSQNGQLMGCCHLMRIYGHRSCVVCGGVVNLIKEGTRQRITYFCPVCQSSGRRDLPPRQHRLEIPLKLPLCSCGDLPALTQCRAGNYWGNSDDRRPYLSCPRRHGSSYDDGGCGVHGEWDGCGLYRWLDEVVELPRCRCGEQGLLRRVVGLRENGRYFVRCASWRCSFRCWLKLGPDSGECGLGTSPEPNRGFGLSFGGALAVELGQGLGHEPLLQEEGPSVAGDAVVPQNGIVTGIVAPRRWQRHTRQNTVVAEPVSTQVSNALTCSGAVGDDGSSSAPETSGEEDHDSMLLPSTQPRSPEPLSKQKRWRSQPKTS